MEVILLENLEGFGRKGDRVEVREGFGRNYLLPHRKALAATPDTLSRLDVMKKRFAAEEAALVKELQGVAGQVDGRTIKLTMRATPEGHLFGSVNAHVITKALLEQQLVVAERCVRIKEPIKTVGTYTVPIHLHADVKVNVTVTVEAEGAPPAEAAAATTATSTDGAAAAPTAPTA